MRKKTKLFLYIFVPVFVVLLIIFLIFSNLGSGYERKLKRIQSGKEDLNIILISIDTLRADHLSPYGYDIETPNIQRLADEGTTFLHCGSPVPLTLPSHISMFTGTYPIRHGAHNNGVVLADEGNIFLSEILQEYNYETSAFIGADILSEKFGFNQGFCYFGNNNITREIASREADDVYYEIMNYLEDFDYEKFFIFIHFYDPHFPYIPPGKYAGEYEDFPYDGEIAFTDEIIGKLLEKFNKMGLLENTLIILTSDHGEAFLEHGVTQHGYFIYETTQHVPLIFWCPGLIKPDHKIEEQVRLVDIPPTVLDILGIDPPVEMDGVSLVDTLIKGNRIKDLPVYCESYSSYYNFGWSKFVGINTSGWKYILAPTPELYDLKNDPDVTINVYNNYPKKVIELDEMLVNMIKESKNKSTVSTSEISMDETSKIDLIGLGYIISGGVIIEGKEDIDPKNKIEFLEMFTDVSFMVGRKNVMSQTEELLLQMIEIEPDISLTYKLLAKEYKNNDMVFKSIDFFKRALELNPDDYEVRSNLAKIYIDIKKYELAERLIDESIKDCTDEIFLSKAHYLKGALIRNQSGDMEKIISHYNTSIKIHPTHYVYNELGLIYIEMGEFDRAEELLKNSIVLENNNPTAYHYLGLIEMYRNNYKSAVEYLIKSLTNLPSENESNNVHYNLAISYISLGENEKGLRHLFEIKGEYMDKDKMIKELQK